MKALCLILALSLLPFYSSAGSVSGKSLLCELVDTARNRILEQRKAVIDPHSTRAILMLMGGGDVMGTVRDFPGKDALNRKIEIILEGTHGFGGHSRGGSQYRLDQEGATNLLAEAELSGEFGSELLLRCFLKSTPALETDYLLFSTTTESGLGHAVGYCQGGSSGYFCIDQIKRHARESARRYGEFSCRSHRGTPRTFDAYCHDFCTPFSIPSGSPAQYVTCDSTCTLTCDTLP